MRPLKKKVAEGIKRNGKSQQKRQANQPSNGRKDRNGLGLINSAHRKSSKIGKEKKDNGIFGDSTGTWNAADLKNGLVEGGKKKNHSL